MTRMLGAMGRWVDARWVIVLANLLGLIAFLLPLAWAWSGAADEARAGGPGTTGAGLPLTLVLVVTLCLVALALENAEHGPGPKAVALVALLVALNAVLRVAETLLPGPGGFSPVFALTILAGRAWGPRLGFQVGALTILVSALLTGGVGVWLPYQMLATGWVGMSAAWLPRPRARPVDASGAPADRSTPSPGRRPPSRPSSGPAAGSTVPPPAPTRGEIRMLALFGAGWGLAYGLILNLWSWTFFGIGTAGVGAGAGASVTVASACPSRFDAWAAPGALPALAAYLLASLPWDLFRSAGNALLLLAFGRPVLAALRRAATRFPSPIPSSNSDLDPDPSQDLDLDLDLDADLDLVVDAGQQPGVLRHDNDEVAIGPDGARGPSAAALDPRLWLAWALGVALLVSLTRNPLVLGMLALVLAAVWRASGPASDPARAGAQATAGPIPPRLVLGFALIAIPFGALYTFLVQHAGDSVLLRLPPCWPLIGGVLSAESLVQGALAGLTLSLLLATFLTLQRALGARALLRLVPRGLGGLSLSLALAYSAAPIVLRRIAGLEEARALRGIQDAPGWSGALRRAPSVVLPLVLGSLDRAETMADTLAARGMGFEGRKLGDGERLIIVLALIGAGTALLAPGLLGSSAAPLLASSLALMLVLRRLSGRTVGAVRQGAVDGIAGDVGDVATDRPSAGPARAAPRRGLDLALVPAALLPALLWWVYPPARETLAWTPYPRLEWPALDALVSLGVLGLVLPALRLRLGPSGLDEAETAEPGAWAAASRPGHHARGRERSEDAAPDLAVSGARSRARRLPSRIQSSGFRFRYPGQGRDALDLEDLSLPVRGLTLVCGRSGVGKTSFLRALAGMLPSTTGGEVRGRLRVLGLDPVRRGTTGMSGFVAQVTGEPDAGLLLDRVGEEVALALELRGVAPVVVRAHVAAALDAVGLAGFEARELETLSGGERQRVAIAAALALAPRLLILDEPSSQLDDTAAEALFTCVASLASQGVSHVIVSEHRLDRLIHLADRVLYLPEQGAPPLVGDVPSLRDRLPARTAEPAPALAMGEPVLEIEGLGFDHRANVAARANGLDPSGSDAPLISDFWLQVRAGEIVALTGPSGSGKTTLLRLITGLETPGRGRIRVRGQDVASRSVAEICSRLAYLPQEASSLFLAEDLESDLRSSAEARGLAYDRASALALLECLGIADLLTAERNPRDASTGQRQRAALALLLLNDPSLILLDEPTRGLDDEAIADLASLLHDLARAGAGILVACHDARLLRAVHRRVALVQ